MNVFFKIFNLQKNGCLFGEKDAIVFCSVLPTSKRFSLNETNNEFNNIFEKYAI